MAKNSQSSKNQEKKKKENRVCEKIFRAVTSPVRTVRRISTKPAEAARLKFSETSTQAAKPITKTEPVITRLDTTVKTDETFTDYIKRAKLKIRAMTNLGDMMNNNDASETSETETRHHVSVTHVSRENSSERSDQFSDYIKKAKMKLRSSSTIARANPTYDSFKD